MYCAVGESPTILLPKAGTTTQAQTTVRWQKVHIIIMYMYVHVLGMDGIHVFVHSTNSAYYEAFLHYNLTLRIRAKHPVKVHVWAGISRQGRTEICIFEGIMDRFLFVDILEKTLIPFLERVLPATHRLMQYNPKHVSHNAQEFFEQNNINWWKTPAESPDLNPIENLWHELKEYIRREIKPKMKDELVQGIVKFWDTVTIEKCNRYINHLKKVIPRVIELEGDATGY